MRSFGWLAVGMGLFGFFVSVNAALTSVIVLDLLSISDFVSGFGVVSLSQGIAALIGPPLAGTLFSPLRVICVFCVGFVVDYTGSYLMVFLIGGVGIQLSGLTVLLIECNRCRRLYYLPEIAPAGEILSYVNFWLL